MGYGLSRARCLSRKRANFRGANVKISFTRQRKEANATIVAREAIGQATQSAGIKVRVVEKARKVKGVRAGAT